MAESAGVRGGIRARSAATAAGLDGAICGAGHERITRFGTSLAATLEAAVILSGRLAVATFVDASWQQGRVRQLNGLRERATMSPRRTPASTGEQSKLV